MRISRHWVATFCCVVVLAGAARAVELKMGVPFPEDTRELKAVGKAIAEIASATNGQLKIALSSFRPNEEGLAKKIFDGELDGGLVMGKGLADLDRDALAYAIPFTFKSYEQVDYVRRDLDAVILRKLSAGPYEALGVVESGFAYVMSSQAVASPDDLRNRKIWVPAEGGFSECVLRLNLTPVVLPLTGVRKGLRDGTVDTIIASPAVAIYARWHREIKKVLDVPFVYTYGIWIVRDDTLKKLPADAWRTVRERLSRSCKELSTFNRDDNDKGRGVLVTWGREFVAPNAIMQKQWELWAEEVWQHLVEKQKPTVEIEGKLKERLRAFDRERN
jgi:TRAP-type C4-dicarboxylate transport system substrate-binding protein